MKTEPDETAYPIVIDSKDFSVGLNKREYFVAMAMQGIISSFGGTITEGDHAYIARHSVMAADFLIIALNEKEEQK